MSVNEESAGSTYLLLRILLYNISPFRMAAVVLKLPVSTRTWQHVRWASLFTLRRGEQLIQAAKHSPYRSQIIKIVLRQIAQIDHEPSHRDGNK